MKALIRSFGVVGLLLAVPVGLSGCSKNDEPMTLASLAKDALDAKTALQAQLLADGTVTVEEYAQASEEMFKCVRASGMTVTHTEPSPLDGFSSGAIFSWEKIGEPEGDAVYTSCAEEFTDFMTPAITYFGEWETPGEVMESMRACMEENGMAVSADAKNYRDLFLGSLGQGQNTTLAEKCLQDSSLEVYGEIHQYHSFVMFENVRGSGNSTVSQ